MYTRCVEPELLDQLPATHRDAIRARADLARLNAVLGHARIVARVLRATGWPNPGTPARLVDLGGGDGAFLSRVATCLPPAWGGVRATLVDRQAVPLDRARRELAAAGWELQVTQADVFAWLAELRPPEPQVMVANLFLHHFQAPALGELLERIADRSDVFIAVEPRRSRSRWLASGLVGLLGCNAVTRHDARLSVRAGFAGDELSRQWPTAGPWRLVERRAGIFSHLFVARKSG